MEKLFSGVFVLFNTFRLFIATSVAASIALHAQTPSFTPEEDLLSILDDATTVITQSKLNVDYTPSVVSVLGHQQLKSLGIKTLFEALSVLPGVETSINQFGIKKVVFRGFDNPNNFTFDKVKLIVDGVAIEIGLFGNTTYYLDLPTDIIERVEVLRGPGSALYGTGAFNGVINVITRQNIASGNGLFFSAGSYDYRMGGVRQHYEINDDTTLHADAYVQKNRKMLPAGDNFYLNNIVNPSTGPVLFSRDLESNEVLDDYSVGMTLNHKAWKLQARIKDNTNGNYYGWDERLELSDEHSTRQRYFFTQLQYHDQVAPNTSLTAQLGYSRYHLELDAQNYFYDPSIGNIVYYFTLDEKEENYNLDTFITTSSFAGQTLITGLSLQSMREVENSINDDLSPYGERAMIKEGLERNILSAYVRDTIELSDNLSALLAGRMDYYDKESKAYFSAQAGVVYTADEHWNFKFNYGHAFRAPSWAEQYTQVYGPGDGTRDGNPDLKAETTDTFEAVAIYRAGEQHLQCNVYYSFMHKVLDTDDIKGSYANRPKRNSRGVELAYTLMPYKQDRLHMNFTYNHTTYLTPEMQIKQAMPGVARFMAKGYYTHYFIPSVSLSTLVKHIGSRNAHEDTTNLARKVDLDPYTTVDVTMNFQTKHHWEIRASVKNLFDEDVRYASYYNRHHQGLPREGVNYLVEFEYTF